MDFAVTMGVDLEQAIKGVNQMRNLRLIYPDGTVNDYAIQFARKRVKKLLEMLNPKKLAQEE
jgi:hypothetical protein